MNANNQVYRHHGHRKAAAKQNDPADVPVASKLALRAAMRLENVSAVQYEDLLWIMNQESGGRVNAKNPHSSARGLFQLLRNNYNLNPHGVDSFGNDVEECQGGIRYIIGRYRSARGARQFWAAHHWY